MNGFFGQHPAGRASAALALLLLLCSSPSRAEEPEPPARLLGKLGADRYRVESAPVDAAFAGDGNRVLTLSADGSIDEWEIASGRLRWTKSLAPRDGTAPTLSPDGGWVAWGTASGFAVAPVGPGGKERPFDDIASTPRMIRFSRDGARVAAACTDGLGVWDLKTGERIGDSSWVGGPPTFLDFSEDGESFVIALRNGEVRRIPVAPGAADGRLESTLGQEQVIAVTATSLISGEGETIGITDLATGRVSRELKWAGDSPCFTAILSRDGKHLAGAATNGHVRIWNLETGMMISEVQAFREGITKLAFSADDKRVAAVSLCAQEPCVIDVASGVRVPNSIEEFSPIVRVVASPDGRLLATYSEARNLSVWSVTDRCRLWRSRGADYSLDVLFSPDSSRVLVTYSDNTVSMEIFDAKTGSVTSRVEQDHSHVALSPDGSKIARRGSNGGFQVRDFASFADESLVAIRRCQVLSLAFSPDGLGLFVVGSRTDNSMVDGNTGFDWYLDEGRLSDGRRRRKPVAIARVVNEACFSPDAQMLAVRLLRSTRILDSRTGAALFETSQTGNSDRSDWQTWLSWSSDGKWLASTRKPGQVDVIDVVHGRRALTIAGPDGSFAWIPGTAMLASTGGKRGTQLLLWDVSAPPAPPPAAAEPLLENSWHALGARPGSGALRAANALVPLGEKAVAFLEKRLKLPPSPPDRVIELVKRAAVAPAAEEDEAGKLAEMALARSLARAGGSAELALRASLETEKDPVIRARLEALLAPHSEPLARTAGDRRETWAIRILEELQARESLRRIAEGPYHSRVRTAAAEALKRLGGAK